MRKVIKLTENDLMRIVQRVINEQSLSLEARLIKNGFSEVKNNLFVKKLENKGDFYFKLKNGRVDISVLNPSEKVIYNLNLKPLKTIKSGKLFTKGTMSDIEAERLSDYIIKSFGSSPQSQDKTITPIEEERFDFENMSDEELHDLHPHVKRHPRHFKDFSPTSEYLGWRGEVDKRNIYKKYGKFHDAFDNEKED